MALGGQVFTFNPLLAAEKWLDKCVSIFCILFVVEYM